MMVTPPFWYAVFRGRVRRYAKGQYAVRKNTVISYTDITFYFKNAQFSPHTTNVTYKKYVKRIL